MNIIIQTEAIQKSHIEKYTYLNFINVTKIVSNQEMIESRNYNRNYFLIVNSDLDLYKENQR